MLLGLGFRFGFGLGPFRSFLGLLDLVLEFGVEGLALLHGQLALLDKISWLFSTVVARAPTPARKTLRRPSPKSKSAMITSLG